MVLTALKQARENIRSNFATTIAGIITTSFALIILGTFILVYLNLIQLTQMVFQKSNYSIFLDTRIDEDARNRIKKHLLTIWGMSEVHEVSAKEARRQLISSFGETGQALEKLDFPQFPDIIEFSLSRSNVLSNRELEEIRQLPGVDEVIFGRETRDQVSIFFTIANFVGVFLIILLVISIILIIHNSVQVALRIRIREIEILEILGATKTFIQLPYICEGIIIAVTGYCISLGLIFMLYEFVVAGITFNEATYGIRQQVRFFTLVEIGNTLLLLILLGLVSSVLASNKIIKELGAIQD